MGDLPEGTVAIHGNDVVLAYANRNDAERAFNILEAAASPTPSLPEDVARVVEQLQSAIDGLDRTGTLGIRPPMQEALALILSLSSQLAEMKENYLIAHSRASERDQECLRLEDEITKQKDRLFRQIDFTGELQRLLWALSQGNDLPETIKDSHAYNVASIVKAERDRLAAELERKVVVAKEALEATREAIALHRSYERTPTDRGGSLGPKGKARSAWIEAEAFAEGRVDTALASLEDQA